MYIIIYEIDRQGRFNAWDGILRVAAIGWPWGMHGEGDGSGIQGGKNMYTHGWFISMYEKTHYNIVK